MKVVYVVQDYEDVLGIFNTYEKALICKHNYIGVEFNDSWVWITEEEIK